MNRIRLSQAAQNFARLPELVACIRSCPEWLSLISAFILDRAPRFPYEFRTRSGESIVLENWDDLTTVWHVFFRGEYRVPRESRTILDLGANIGCFSVWAAARCPAAKIYSLEPFPETFTRLTDCLERNQLRRRVQPIQLAIAGHDGPASFDATREKRSYCRQLVETDAVETIVVECITLESLLNRLSVSEIDCLKMDVEGGEYAVLAQCSIATLRRVKSITMEYHDAQRAPVLWQKLKRAHFKRIHLEATGWSGLASFERLD